MNNKCEMHSKYENELITLNLKIKDLYDKLSTNLVKSKNIVTSDIQDIYKQIDSTFNLKSKLQATIKELEIDILKSTLINYKGI